MSSDMGSGPMRVGLPIVVYIAGHALVAAILGALLQRARKPDVPQRLSVSMLDAITTMMGAYATHHQTTGALRGLEGNRAFADTPFSGRFKTADGMLVITANTPAQVARLCAAQIAKVLANIFLTKDAQAWVEHLSAANIPVARVRTLAGALAHPQTTTSRAWLPLDVPQLNIQVRAPALPFDAPWGPEHLAPVPTLGQHNPDLATQKQKVSP